MNIKETLNTYKGLPKEIYILFIGKIVNSIGSFVHPLMTLILTQQIGLSNSQAGEIITMSLICQAPAVILGGKLADKIGRRKVIIIFQLLGAICLFSCGFMEPSLNMAYIMILSSCFYSMSSPAYDALNADLTTEENRQRAYSLLYMGVNIGFSIGPILGGLLYKKYLPLVFIFDASTTLISLALFIKYVKETMNNKFCSMNEVSTDIELSQKQSTIKILYQRPILIFFSLAMLIYHFGYSQVGFALPLQLQEIFNDSGATVYGVVAGFNGFIVILLTPILTSLTKTYNPIKIMSLGGMFYAVSFLLYGAVNREYLFLFAMFIMTTGEVLVAINQGAFIASRIPETHRGRISSILPLIIGVGNGIGPILMGGFIDYYGMFQAWILVFIIVLSGALFMRTLTLFDNTKEEVIE